MVHGADLGIAWPLHAIAHAFNGRFDPSIFPATTCSIREPHATPQIFSSGRVVIPGPKTSQEALLCLRMLEWRAIDQLGIFADVHNFCLDNIVGSFCIGYPIDLDLFFAHNQLTSDGRTNWDPSLFPGLNYFMKQPVKLQFGIYQTGNVVVLGAPNYAHLECGTNYMMKMLERYRVGSPESLALDSSQRRSRLVVEHKQRVAEQKAHALDAKRKRKTDNRDKRKHPEIP